MTPIGCCAVCPVADPCRAWGGTENQRVTRTDTTAAQLVLVGGRAMLSQQ